jgi:small redox-active disulfide protein 2
MLQIKILGTGCPNCKKLAEETEKVVSTLTVEAVVEKVTDYQEILKYDLLSTPGLVINEQVVSSGRIPSRDEITTFLNQAIDETS